MLLKKCLEQSLKGVPKVRIPNRKKIIYRRHPTMNSSRYFKEIPRGNLRISVAIYVEFPISAGFLEELQEDVWEESLDEITERIVEEFMEQS